MAWPTDDLTTTHYDQATDDPSLARSEILDLKTKLSEVIAGRAAANGVCDLDASTEVPMARLKTGVANGVASLGADARLNASEVPSFRGAYVSKTGASNQSVISGIAANITYATETYDTDNIWAVANADRLVVPSGVTRVRLFAQVVWTSAVTGLRVSINTDGAGIVARTDYSSNSMLRVQIATPVIAVGSTSYYVIEVLHTTGTSRVIDGGGGNYAALEVIE